MTRFFRGLLSCVAFSITVSLITITIGDQSLFVANIINFSIGLAAILYILHGFMSEMGKDEEIQADPEFRRFMCILGSIVFACSVSGEIIAFHMTRNWSPKYTLLIDTIGALLGAAVGYAVITIWDFIDDTFYG